MVKPRLHFHHSSVRKEYYKEFLEFTDTEPIKIQKHTQHQMANLGEVCESFNAPLASPPELFQLPGG